jgi:hypothetical protein
MGVLLSARSTSGSPSPTGLVILLFLAWFVCKAAGKALDKVAQRTGIEADSLSEGIEADHRQIGQFRYRRP